MNASRPAKRPSPPVNRRPACRSRPSCHQPPAPIVDPAPPVAFPRTGEVFVFRQLQGTGAISFVTHSRVARGGWMDIGIALGVSLLAALGYFLGPGVVAFAMRRRVALLVAAGVASVALGLARDVGVILLFVAATFAILGLFGRRRDP